jgi:hypothetical protein
MNKTPLSYTEEFKRDAVRLGAGGHQVVTGEAGRRGGQAAAKGVLAQNHFRNGLDMIFAALPDPSFRFAALSSFPCH